jgi:hypothetical protein
MAPVTNLFPLVEFESQQCSERVVDFLRKTMNEAWLDSSLQEGAPCHSFTRFFQMEVGQSSRYRISHKRWWEREKGIPK